MQQVPILRLPTRLRSATRVKRRSSAGCEDSRCPPQAPRPSRTVSREVEDLVRQQRYESEGAVNLIIKGVQDTINADLQKIIAGVASTDSKVMELAAESERAMKMVSAESEKFASKVAGDKTEMDSCSESFRLAGVALEAQLSEGLSKIKSAQAAADAANLMQSESTRATLANILEHEPTATGAAAGVPIDPMQRRNDWQRQSLGLGRYHLHCPLRPGREIHHLGVGGRHTCDDLLHVRVDRLLHSLDNEIHRSLSFKPLLPHRIFNLT